MTLACRAGRGACCIAPSIASPLLGMPHGKAAGMRCVQLDADNMCRVFGRPERPAFRAGLRPDPEIRGADAPRRLAALEARTRPDLPSNPENPWISRY